jgi:hypothetical protein
LKTNLKESESAGKVGNSERETPCVFRAMLRGSIGFGFVSLVAFSIWAFGGKWFQAHTGFFWAGK